MELSPDIINLLKDGGMATAFFIVWYITQRAHRADINRVIESIEKDRTQDRDQRDALIRVMTRLEIKLDMSIQNQMSQERHS